MTIPRLWYRFYLKGKASPVLFWYNVFGPVDMGHGQGRDQVPAETPGPSPEETEDGVSKARKHGRRL